MMFPLPSQFYTMELDSHIMGIMSVRSKTPGSRGLELQVSGNGLPEGDEDVTARSAHASAHGPLRVAAAGGNLRSHRGVHRPRPRITVTASTGLSLEATLSTA